MTSSTGLTLSTTGRGSGGTNNNIPTYLLYANTYLYVAIVNTLLQHMYVRIYFMYTIYYVCTHICMYTGMVGYKGSSFRFA